MSINADSDKRIAALDSALAKGISDVEAKRIMPAEEVFDRLEAKYRKLAESQALARAHSHD
ncbi:hypothetical protein [Mesorhizobium sp. WSM3859]|uniref:hypothetical protein n=1 Tax=Mesorhizobium sp. WSM3859 TaxID=2029402 RepID=UPI000BAF51C5|nr:hypothetical protein [Mesorhizobium sp. WSM3859]PBC10368.1 hypothetical protein CK230_11670 [Mesorhizobium sp. WSM3859]